MHEIGVQAVVACRNIIQKGVGPVLYKSVPAHVRDFQRRIDRAYRANFAGNPSQSRRHPMLQTAIRQ